MTRFDFYFEESGLGEQVGPVDPAEEYFVGERAIAALAREIGQNSLDAVQLDDARAEVWPVVVEFETADMPIDEVPGIATLREHFGRAADTWVGDSGHERLVAAKELADREAITVLRISDFGTSGLTGSESRENPKSPLSALTRGAGISSKPGGGGSFGIGSAVGYMASDLRTVLYTSLPAGEDEVVLAGYSRLASHKDAAGLWRGAHGYLTDVSDTSDFRYWRGAPAVGPFERRTEPGTDVFVLGYRMIEADPDLSRVRDAYVRDFMLAIHRGHLVVRGKTPQGQWELSAETLPTHVNDLADAQAFYLAINDPEPIVDVHEHLGEVRLYVHVNDALPTSHHAQMLRRQLMKIGTYRPTTITAKYAAVFECSNRAGNDLLRALEPPEHNTWDPGRAPGGYALVHYVRKFIRDGVASRVKRDIGESLEIQGLARLLPAELSFGNPGSSKSGSPGTGDGVADESSTVQGEPNEEAEAVEIRQGRSVRVSVSTPGITGGVDQGKTGRQRGGDGIRGSDQQGIDADVEPGDGRSRIPVGSLRFRTWAGGPKRIMMSLAVDKPVIGDLDLVPLGPAGTPETDYLLPIKQVIRMTEDGSQPVTFAENTLRDLDLAVGVTQFEIELSGDHRYRLGVR